MTRVAAIDCGTNSIRLLVADVDGAGADRAGLTDITRRMEIVRLGQGVDRTGLLAPESIERTRAALADYADEIERHRATAVRMVATSASRDARNAEDFRTMVKATLGVLPEVISGREEAELSFAGAVRGLPAGTPAPYLVVDIGGGSTEFVRGTSTVDAACSVDVGCVRMTERHLHDDPPTAAQVRAARADITAAVDRALAAVGAAAPAADAGPPPAGSPAAGSRTLVGLAGSVTTVAAIALGLPEYQPERIHHARIRADLVSRVAADLLAMTRARRLALPVMHPGRADVIGAGALVLDVIMRRAGFDSVVASEHDILDGIAWGLASSS
jgi:exopolyphosphatase/guanosine-5'-triphosphate,3'-diphosphate pyrophosphatase